MSINDEFGKDLEGRCCGLMLRLYTGIRLEELGKTTKNVRQCSRSPCRDLMSVPTEYEADVLTTRPLLSVPETTW